MYANYRKLIILPDVPNDDAMWQHIMFHAFVLPIIVGIMRNDGLSIITEYIQNKSSLVDELN